MERERNRQKKIVQKNVKNRNKQKIKVKRKSAGMKR